MILILTEAFDPHADYVIQKLQKRGADFVRFNPAQFPSEAEASIFLSEDRIQQMLRVGKEYIDLTDLKAVWYRRPKSPIAHEEITNDINRKIVEDECKTFVNDLWSSLTCQWLPAPPHMIKQAEFKAFQLKIAMKLGFKLPPTLFTNSPDEFLEFYRQHNGNIISKAVGTSFHRFVGDFFCRYTEVVSKRDVGYAHSVRYCPMIFQAYVPKHLELRITVVGQQVFAAEIHSQETNHTRYDWRRYNHHKTPYFPHELPPELERRCVQLVEKLGLCYGAIDMILKPDGSYVFLEINPNGQYLWVEHATALPISDAICELLMSGIPKNKRVETHIQDIQEIYYE
jgi:predicted ATP-grasp superfamily ATP-dependent carboligase